jgi:hypothetical protein
MVFQLSVIERLKLTRERRIANKPRLAEVLQLFKILFAGVDLAPFDLKLGGPVVVFLFTRNRGVEISKVCIPGKGNNL